MAKVMKLEEKQNIISKIDMPKKDVEENIKIRIFFKRTKWSLMGVM